MSNHRRLRALAVVLSATYLILLMGMPVVSAADIRIWVEPAQVEADFSAEFTVQVMIENVTDLGYFQFTLEYDPRVVLAKGAVLGEFLGSTGRSTSGLGPRIDNSKGTLTFGGFSFGTAKGPEGKGVLAEVTFSGLARGLSSLQLKNVLISDSNNQSLKGFRLEGGVVAVAGAPVVTPEPTATPVMVTMTPVSLPTSAWTFTPPPRPPATVVSATPSVSLDQSTATSTPRSPATISSTATVLQATTATAVPSGSTPTVAPTAADVVTMTPVRQQETASLPSPTAVAEVEGAPTIVSTSAPILAVRTASVTSMPILPGAVSGSASQGAEAPSGGSIRKTPTWLIIAGLAAISLSAASLVILALIRFRRGRDA